MSDFTVLCIGVDGWVRHWVVICDTHWVLRVTAGRMSVALLAEIILGVLDSVLYISLILKPLQVRSLNCTGTGTENLVW